MIIKWMPEALEDLSSLRAWIGRDSPQAAQRTALRVIEAVETTLSDFPESGRPGRIAGTRELVVVRTPYVVPYRLRDGVLEVLRVYHGARRWPDSF